jgi:thiol-disulfide isomerase/thioredoxin
VRTTWSGRPLGLPLGPLPSLLLGLLLGLTACGPAGAERTGPPRAGNPVPEVAGTTLAGDSLRLSDFAGGPVLVNLWATWCPPCREEMPYLQSLHERFAPQGLRTVAISVDDASARKQVRSFVADAGVTFDVLLDPRGRSMDLFQVIGLPGTFLVDAEGVIRLVRIGPVLPADTAFVRALEALVGT